MEDLVSIIIPALNREDTVERAIDSVLNQTHSPIEIVFVDDGSTDKTGEIVQEKYKDQVRYIYQKNKGLSGARNTGIENSTGEYIGFLDSDDYFLPNSVEEKLKVLKANPDVYWVFSDTKYQNEAGKIYKDSMYSPKTIEMLENSENLFYTFFMSEVSFVQCNTMLLKKECFDRIGGFDEDHPGCLEEHDLSLRLSKEFKGKLIPEPFSVQVRLPGGLSSVPETTFRARRLLIEMIKKKFPEEVEKYNWPPRFSKWRANIHNYYGQENLKKGDKKGAREEFLASINAYPIQGSVYLNLLKSLIG